MPSEPHTRYSDFSPATVRRLWTGFAIILLLCLVAGLFVHAHAHFGIDGTPFFYAWYGFAACAAIILFSKLLGLFLKRQEDYFTRRRND